jgi:hypothetical protein
MGGCGNVESSNFRVHFNFGSLSGMDWTDEVVEDDIHKGKLTTAEPGPPVILLRFVFFAFTLSISILEKIE